MIHHIISATLTYNQWIMTTQQHSLHSKKIFEWKHSRSVQGLVKRGLLRIVTYLIIYFIGTLQFKWKKYFFYILCTTGIVLHREEFPIEIPVYSLLNWLRINTFRMVSSLKWKYIWPLTLLLPKYGPVYQIRLEHLGQSVEGDCLFYLSETYTFSWISCYPNRRKLSILHKL